MALFYIPRCVAWDADRAAAAVDGIEVRAYDAEQGGSIVQMYSAAGDPVTLYTEGYTVPPAYATDVKGVWYDAGAGRFWVESPTWASQMVESVTAGVATIGAFEARVAALEAAAGTGGGGGAQLGLVEDVFTIAAEDGSTLVGAAGTIVNRTAFPYALVPAGHRLVIKDHPDYAASAVQPLLPAAFWAEAAKANPQAELVSYRTPVTG